MSMRSCVLCVCMVVGLAVGFGPVRDLQASESGGEAEASGEVDDVSEADDASEAAETDDGSKAAEATETDGDPEADTADEADSEQESDQQSPIQFAPPAEPRLELGIGGYTWLWDTAYGGNEVERVPRVTVRWFPTRLLAISLAADWGLHRSNAADLSIVNQHASAMAGVGVVGWLNSFRLGLEAQGGMLLRTVRLDDGAGTTFSDARFEPTAGFEAHAGMTVAGRASLSLAGGARFYAPKRSDIFLGLRFDWTFGSGS